MTPKEKANELMDKFEQFTADTTFQDKTTAAKYCAIICVDDKIHSLMIFKEEYNINDEWFDDVYDTEVKYLEKVKKELNLIKR